MPRTPSVSVISPVPWWTPFAAAALAWNLVALLGALASHGDAQQGATHPPFLPTLLHFVLLYLPLSVLSLMLARCLPASPRQLAVTSLAFLPLLAVWQSAISGVPLARQSALAWWFDALLLAIAMGGHLAYHNWRRAHEQTLARQRAQQENLALRLRLLQGQLEPYFLAGSLAGIGKLVRSERRDQATSALVRLSDLLRYALRSSRSDWQSMADEVQFLRDYIALQCLCHDTELPVHWQLGQDDWSGYRCPPLLLFPLVDQAVRAALVHVHPIAIGMRRDADYLRSEVRFQGSAHAMPELRARLAMLFSGAARLEIQQQGGRTCICLAYPVTHHDD